MLYVSHMFHVLPEMYQQNLAKALAHHFEAKLLLLDASDFSLKVSREVINFSCSLLSQASDNFSLLFLLTLI